MSTSSDLFNLSELFLDEICVVFSINDSLISDDSIRFYVPVLRFSVTIESSEIKLSLIEKTTHISSKNNSDKLNKSDDVDKLYKVYKLNKLNKLDDVDEIDKLDKLYKLYKLDKVDKLYKLYKLDKMDAIDSN